MKLHEHLAQDIGGPLKVLGTLAVPLATSGTINTTTTHAHGLKDARGRAVTPTVVILQGATAGQTGVLMFMAVDATNISVRSNIATQSFLAYVG